MGHDPAADGEAHAKAPHDLPQLRAGDLAPLDDFHKPEPRHHPKFYSLPEWTAQKKSELPVLTTNMAFPRSENVQELWKRVYGSVLCEVVANKGNTQLTLGNVVSGLISSDMALCGENNKRTNISTPNWLEPSGEATPPPKKKENGH